MKINTERRKPPMTCRVLVYKREKLRYTGRTKSGLERHYTQQRCSRSAVIDGYCNQHHKMKARGRKLVRDGRE